jgi:hypothetical protein
MPAYLAAVNPNIVKPVLSFYGPQALRAGGRHAIIPYFPKGALLNRT